MCTHGEWALQTLITRYCKSSGSSAGVRALLRDDFRAFAARNPQLTVEARHEALRAPRVVGRYRDGTSREVDLKNKTAAEVIAVFQRLRDSATGARRSFRKPVASVTPTIQGVWDASITYKGFSLTELPRAGGAKARAAARPPGISLTALMSERRPVTPGPLRTAPPLQ